MTVRSAVAVVLGLAASPAWGDDRPTLAEVGAAYCAAALSGELAPLLPLLTDDFRAVIESAGDRPVRLLGIEAPPASCMPVGNSGTAERPENIVAFRYGAAAASGAVNIVAVFVDGRLRIDDVRFAAGDTLRERIAEAP